MGRKRRYHVLKLKRERELKEAGDAAKKSIVRPVEAPTIDLKIKAVETSEVQNKKPSEPKLEVKKPPPKTRRTKTTKSASEKKPRSRRTAKTTTLSANEKKPIRRRRTTKKVVEKTDDQ